MSPGAFFPARSGEEAPCPDVCRASGVRWVKVIKFIEETRKKDRRSRRPARPDENPRVAQHPQRCRATSIPSSCSPTADNTRIVQVHILLIASESLADGSKTSGICWTSCGYGSMGHAVLATLPAFD